MKEKSSVCGDIFMVKTTGARVNLSDMKVMNIPVTITYSSNHTGSTHTICDNAANKQLCVPFEAVIALMDAQKTEGS